MSAFKASASDFEDWDKEFTPSAQHFDEWDKEEPLEDPKVNLDKLKQAHPIIYSLAEKLQKHPNISSAIEGIADSPGLQVGLGAGLSLVNAFANMINAPSEIFLGKKVVPNLSESPEPQDLSGKIGRKVGDILGAGTAFAAVPGSTSLAGGLATGFAQTGGDIINRGMGALVGMLITSLFHTTKIGKNFLKTKGQEKQIKNLEREKSAAERSVFGAKEKLAEKLSNEAGPLKEEQEKLAGSLKDLAGSSESESKKQVASLTQKAEKHIVDKYKKLYEGFNEGEAGQSEVKDPVKIDSLKKEYGLTENDFSTDSKKLINKLVGKSVHEPSGNIISSKTGQPINQANISLQQAKAPKVADYINLWKQLRAEVAEYRHSGKMAQTPEAKRVFRDKANQLEKLSDDINSKAMGSLSRNQQKEYSTIQKGYMNERVPFLEKPVLRNATDKFGEVPDNFFEKLNKSGVPDLLKTFQKEHPELVSAITKHDIRGMTNLSADKLKELVSGDFGRFIPKEVRGVIESLRQKKSAEGLLNQALSKVQASELARKIKSSEINEIIKSRPDLSKPFKNIAEEQGRLRKIKDALIDSGFKLKDAEAELKKYKTILSCVKSAGLPIGAYAGIVKSKGVSSNED